MNKSPIFLILMLLSMGCAKSDWIQQTLVTVDVTGTWVGSFGTGNAVSDVRLGLEQEGTKVKGNFRRVGAGIGLMPLLEGPIDGTVSGDVFTFTLTTGRGGNGELTVSGDEMTGHLHAGSRIPIALRRIDSSPPPRPQ